MTPTSILSDARALCAHGVCQGYDARDAEGLEVGWDSERAATWSIVGAVLKAGGGPCAEQMASVS